MKRRSRSIANFRVAKGANLWSGLQKTVGPGRFDIIRTLQMFRMFIVVFSDLQWCLVMRFGIQNRRLKSLLWLVPLSFKGCTDDWCASLVVRVWCRPSRKHGQKRPLAWHVCTGPLTTNLPSTQSTHHLSLRCLPDSLRWNASLIVMEGWGKSVLATSSHSFPFCLQAEVRKLAKGCQMAWGCDQQRQYSTIRESLYEFTLAESETHIRHPSSFRVQDNLLELLVGPFKQLKTPISRRGWSSLTRRCSSTMLQRSSGRACCGGGAEISCRRGSKATNGDEMSHCLWGDARLW